MSELKKEYTMGLLLKFAFPTIIMTMITSLYSIIDGMFVARFLNPTAFVAINMIIPIFSIFAAIGITFGAGGSALISKKLGEDKLQEARKDFTLLALVTFVIGVILAIVIYLLRSSLFDLLNITEEVLPYVTGYFNIIIIGMPLFIMQILFEYYLILAGKAKIGLIASLCTGVMNISVNYVLLGVMGLGIRAAATGTAISFLIPTTIGLIYFGRRQNELHFVKPEWNKQAIVEAIKNGSSQTLEILASAIMIGLFNREIMNIMGEVGVQIISIIIYTQMLFNGIFLGFINGISPIIGYKHGAKKYVQLKFITKKGLFIIASTSIAVFIIALSLAPYIVNIFKSSQAESFQMAINALRLFSTSYLFVGFNIFVTILFVSLSNGKISSILSFARTLGFFIPSLFILPALIGYSGIWLIIPVVELLCLLVTVFCFYRFRKKYNYA